MNTKTKHTSGPWKWQRHEMAGGDTLRGKNDVMILDDGSAGGEYDAKINTQGPDARLIAAAPELLEASLAVAKIFRGYSIMAVKILEKAIASATGEDI